MTKIIIIKKKTKKSYQKTTKKLVQFVLYNKLKECN